MFHTESPLTRRATRSASALLVGGGGILALVLWTLPNWQEFWSHVSEFPALWQIPANHVILIVLVLKICSPVCVMLCLYMGVALARLTQRPEVEHTATESVSPAPFAPGGAAILSRAGANAASVPLYPLSPDLPQWPEDARASRAPALLRADTRQQGKEDGETTTRSFEHEEHAPSCEQASQMPVWAQEEPVPMLDLSGMLPQPEAAAPDEGSVGGIDEEPLLVPDLCLEPATETEPAFLLQGLHSLREKHPSSGPDRSESPPCARDATNVERPQGTMWDVWAQQSSLPEPEGTPGGATSTRPLLMLRFLKEMSLTLCVPDGREVVVPLTSHAKRLQLLAYIGWRRGEMIDREKVLEQVFGWGLSDEEATEDKLTERFESHKKLLRKKIREVATGVNMAAGTEVLNPEIDPFVYDTGFWGLSGVCHVEDLSVIEAHHAVIAQARKAGRLVEAIPDEVKDACDRLIASYPGDFLETIIKKHAGEFRPFQGRSSWARKPFTLFRDYYLDALWYAAEYEMQHGQRCAGVDEEEEGTFSQSIQHTQYARAAQYYQTYALYACNTRFDAKATINAHGDCGERIGMSERALRRCVVLLGTLGKTDHINQLWSAYLAQMKLTFDQRWTPSKETVADVEAARAQTNAYRFAAQVSQLSSAFAQRRGMEEGNS